jgi:hypothetical protein
VTILERPPVDWERHRGDKRPKILPPPGETWRNPGTNRKVGHRYYTRVTTFADAITESYNLTNWKLAKLLIGLGQRADYVRQAAALTMEERDRDARDELVGKVLDAAGPDAAGLGTALHALTERLDRGEDIGTPPDEMLPDLAAYTAITEGTLTILLREPRTVCDELECAGTPDTIAVVHEAPPTGEGLPVCDCPPERPRVVDTKTGSIRYPGKMSTQLSIYAHSDRYDPGTGERIPLDVCPHWGVIVHLPVETGEAALFWLDLEHGWRGALLCGPVRQWHKAKADDVLMPFATVQPVKVVDGEVTRIEPRLASVNLKAPAPVASSDITDQLADALTASLAERGVPVAGLDESENAADLDGTDGVPGRDDPRWDEGASVGQLDGGVDLDTPAEPYRPEEPTELEETRRPGLPIAPGPDTCAHSGGRTMRGNALVCRDCGEPAGFGPEQPATAAPVEVAETVHRAIVGDEADRPAPWPGVDDVSVEELASGPDSDAEDEPASDDAEIERQAAAARAEFLEAAASGETVESLVDPARSIPVDEALRDRDDPRVDEILRCVTTRDLELLGTSKWREWDQSHRDLAAGTHAELEEREAAAKPRAAAEAAIITAATLEVLNAIMSEVAEAPWMTDDLRDLATDRWRQLKAGPAAVTA